MMAVLFLCWGNPAEAQQPKATESTAQTAMEQKNWDEAIRLYTELYNKNQKSEYQINIGTAYLQKDDSCNAMTWYDEAIKDKKLDQSTKTTLEEIIADLGCWSITVKVTPTEKNVWITVNKNSIGTTGNDGTAVIAQQFPKGSVTFTATTTDGRISSETVDLPSGKGDKNITIMLPKPEKQVGTLKVRCLLPEGVKNGEIFVDNTLKGQVTSQKNTIQLELDPGDHVVSCRVPQGTQADAQVIISTFQPTAITLKPQDKSKQVVNPPDEFSWKLPTVLGIGGLSVGLLATGVYFNFEAKTHAGDLDTLAGIQASGKLQDPSEALRLQGKLESANKNMAVFYISGGLLALADATLLLFWDDLFEALDQPVEITITPTGDGWAGAFSITF